MNRSHIISEIVNMISDTYFHHIGTKYPRLDIDSKHYDQKHLPVGVFHDMKDLCFLWSVTDSNRCMKRLILIFFPQLG